MGSWQTVSVEKDGKQDPGGAGGKLVFMEDTMHLGGMAHWYRLKPAQSPKQLDFNVEGLNTPHLAIYQLEGDMLSICFATLGSAPRPSVFETAPNDGNQLLVCRRVKALLPDAVDVQFDPSLKDAITEGIALLESNEIEKYLERFASPDELRSLKQSRWEETVKHVGSQRDTLLSTFRALLKLKPAMNADGAEAVFDLSQAHIEGSVPMPEMRFRKTDGQWHLLNR